MTHRPAPWLSLLALAGFLLLSFGAAATGVLFPPGDWYASLERPFYAPPNWLFGPVWTVLYIAMAVSAWLVWRQVGLRSAAMAWWLIQLAFNALWTPLFFGLQSPGLALLGMTVLWPAILICLRHFRPISKTAFWLMVPYLAWVSFAWILNAGFWWLN